MSMYEDDFEDAEEPRQNPVRARMKELEKRLADYEKQISELGSIKKENVFIKAGIDSSDPKFRYFVKGYDGDLTPEAVRQAAEEAQLIAPTQAPEAQADKQKWQETNRVAAGSETAPPPPSWAKRIADANSRDEVFAIFAEAEAQGIDLSSI